MFKSMNYIEFLLLINLFRLIACFDMHSFIITSEEEPQSRLNDDYDDDDQEINGPEIYSMSIKTYIRSRYATTFVTSKVINLKNTSQETTFSVTLPETAFISNFLMEIDGKSYKAKVKKRLEAKNIYDEAVANGHTAGQVSVARNSKQFQISVNLEPYNKANFHLLYEELLQRKYGRYELILNIDPGQIVEDLNAEVYINESRPLDFVRVPLLKNINGQDINDNSSNTKLDPHAFIVRSGNNSNSAFIRFNPSRIKQRQYARYLNIGNENPSKNGLNAQFIVHYDVVRDASGGEILIKDGYFVHFFAPTDLKQLPKHVIFILDHSGSMDGRKIEQLTEAMKKILPQLKSEDLFSIVRFSDNVLVVKIDDNTSDFIKVLDNNRFNDYVNFQTTFNENLPIAIQATSENIEKAIKCIENIDNLEMTNIIGGLEVGVHLMKTTQNNNNNKYKPLIIFLTDGQPNVGITKPQEIIKLVTEFNSNQSSIFSLALGNDADREFLKNLSLANRGFARLIYEDSDTWIQLGQFYQEISSPLLDNVTFKYTDLQDVTKTNFATYFEGSELVVAGKTNVSQISPHIDSNVYGGDAGEFLPDIGEPVGSLERLWAYLTVKQILDGDLNNGKESIEKALNLALKFSFVTPLSALAVGKPDGQIIDDNAMVRPFYKPPPDLDSIPVNIVEGEIVQVEFPTESPPTTTTEIPTTTTIFTTTTTEMPITTEMLTTTEVPTTITTEIPTTTTTKRSWMPPNPLYPRSTIPLWIIQIKNNNDNLYTPQGIYKLGNLNNNFDCPLTPLNTSGTCTFLFNCPSMLALLPNKQAYFKYFCPLNEHAGICCPETEIVTNPTSSSSSTTTLIKSLPNNRTTIKTTIPFWIVRLKSKTDTIKTKMGVYKLGKLGEYFDCRQTPRQDNTQGRCTFLFRCPSMLVEFYNEKEYLPYFCPLNKFAGICCPEDAII